MPSAIVVGAGPAGVLTSVYLAQLGYAVDVFERREEPSQAQASSQHSYPMVLANRATVCIAEAGLQPACCTEPTARPCCGHYSLGKLRGGGDPKSLGPEMVTWVVDRVGLAADLLAEACRVYPDRIRFHFNAALTELDLAARRVVFSLAQPNGGSTSTQEVCGYDLLVGADGASSGVRAAMAAQLPPERFSAELLYQSVVVYRTFHGLPRTRPAAPGPDASAAPERPVPVPVEELVPGIGEHLPKQHLYWYDNRTGPLVTFWINEAGQLDGLVSKVTDWSASALSSLIRSVHPAIPPYLVDGIVEQVCPKQPSAEASSAAPESAPAGGGSRFGCVVRCRPFHAAEEGVVLVGDAAHPVTGHLGQGANMALESARALAAALRRFGPGRQAEALAAYSAERAADTAACQHLEMSMAAFVLPPVYRPGGGKAGKAGAKGGPEEGGAGAAEGAAGSAPFSLGFRLYAAWLIMGSMMVGLAGHKLAPAAFPLPIWLMAATRDSRLRYSVILQRARLMAGGLVLAGGAAAVASVALAVRWWRR
ncbi:hypothetical protein HYH02_010910 [Chlamydomonas schloesseri]|uniref:FAD-binding domain-containing protein n=1 Tax=Chlamydomonas schloesseri TaxID=2026947 RepID=A0A835TIP6_9CHLO|nr:hypothetical protein HYH02_010910 [Chlamydomonas schloesseri]|eukprot:KAG2438455.1 hypothetical protein HYH02_010910 [Chlamydomonas schloesseri]